MDDNGFKFAKVMDYSDSGELIFIGFIRVDHRKECPNCFAMFLKMENRHKSLRTMEKLLVNSTDVRFVSAGSRHTVIKQRNISIGIL